MTIAKLKAAFDRALSAKTVTKSDVDAFERAVRDGEVVSPREAAALRSFVTRYNARLDPAAAQRLDELLKSLPPSSAPPAPSPPFPKRPPPLSDPRTYELGLRLFDELSSSLSSGALTPTEQLRLAAAGAAIGIMGVGQAMHAVKRLEQLTPTDADRFRSLADQSRSPLERAFLYKALGADVSIADLERFAATIRAWSPPRLLNELSLADATIDDRPLRDSPSAEACVVTTAQWLRAEVDPVYALAVRRGTVPEEVSLKTGPSFTLVDLCHHSAEERAHVLDLVTAQVARGVPTPLLIGNELDPKRHAVLAIELKGSGDGQTLRLHDPWGDGFLVSRSQLLERTAPLGTFDRLGAVHLIGS